MWVLEFRRVKNGEWIPWVRGTLEECLEDALALKAGEHGWGSSYDASRLGFEREHNERCDDSCVYQQMSDRAANAIAELALADAELRGLVSPSLVGDTVVFPMADPHIHSWAEDSMRQQWYCVGSPGNPCQAVVTREELAWSHDAITITDLPRYPECHRRSEGTQQ